MASREQQDLAAKIKGTHRNLRIQAKKLGPEKAWNDHLTDSETLKIYAASMKKLSEHYWKSNLAERSGESRITWTVEFSKFYFQSLEILNCRNKELQVIDKIREEPLPDKRLEVDETEFLKISNKQNLLDVGSSFNPFKQFDQFFNVTAIDIAPADKSVFECDFLRVKIDGFQMETSENEIVSLPESFFDIVVFSLLLEYLPSSEQRILCCEKAYNCLRKEGILVILTPGNIHKNHLSEEQSKAFSISFLSRLQKPAYQCKTDKKLAIHVSTNRLSTNQTHKTEKFDLSGL